MGWRAVVALSLVTAGCCASTTDEPLLNLDLSEARRLQSATVSGSRLSFGGGAYTIERCCMPAGMSSFGGNNA